MPIEVLTLSEWIASGETGLLSLVIPAHNEEGDIEQTVRELNQALVKEGMRHEILVINDNSSDNTEEILKRLSSEITEVRYLNNSPPYGFGFAVRRGLAHFTGDAVAIVMADGSETSGDIIAFYHKLQEGYDCVFGSRFIRGGKCVNYPWFKMILNRIGNTLVRVLFWSAYNDFSNAFKMYRREVIAGIQPLLACHFNLTVEMPLKSMVRGYRYIVLPNIWINRKHGRSKFKIKEMGSRYLFIIIYCFCEKLLLHNDYIKDKDIRDRSLQVWPH